MGRLYISACNINQQYQCRNGARCQTNNVGGFTCICTAGYRGTYCEQRKIPTPHKIVVSKDPYVQPSIEIRKFKYPICCSALQKNIFQNANKFCFFVT